jgi:hypothetical protein
MKRHRPRSKLAMVGALCLLALGGVAAPAYAGFDGEIKPLDERLRQHMKGSSWHRGCPIGLDRLRLLRLTHWGFDDQEKTGRLIVRHSEAVEIRDVFASLYQQRFPIEKMHLIDRYDGSDTRSMRANNTSAFNCRTVAGTSRWSEHAYGTALDINPVQNPYVSGSHVSPEEGRAYLDRSNVREGMVTEGVVRAFRTLAGWSWGGNWSGAKDYQHFSRSGH